MITIDFVYTAEMSNLRRRGMDILPEKASILGKNAGSAADGSGQHNKTKKNARNTQTAVCDAMPDAAFLFKLIRSARSFLQYSHVFWQATHVPTGSSILSRPLFSSPRQGSVDYNLFPDQL